MQYKRTHSVSETNDSDRHPPSIMSSSNAKPILSIDQRNAIYHNLLEKSQNGKLPRGSLTELSNEYNVCYKTIYRIWQQERLSLQEGAVAAQVNSRKYGNYGRPKGSADEIKKAVQEVPQRKRKEYQRLSNASVVPVGT